MERSPTRAVSRECVRGAVAFTEKFKSSQANPRAGPSLFFAGPRCWISSATIMWCPQKITTKDLHSQPGRTVCDDKCREAAIHPQDEHHVGPLGQTSSIPLSLCSTCCFATTVTIDGNKRLRPVPFFARTYWALCQLGPASSA
jgi:hypothetical protein